MSYPVSCHRKSRLKSRYEEDSGGDDDDDMMMMMI
jgi:hypothetical protein